MAKPLAWPALSAKELEAVARRRRGEPVRSIMRELRISGQALYMAFRKAGLPIGRTSQPPPLPIAPPVVGPFPSGAEAEPLTAEMSLDEIERRLGRLLAREVAKLEAGGATGDPERAASALASNVRSLGLLRRTRTHNLDDAPRDQPPPRSIAQLRDELHGHLQRIRLETRARRRARRAEADRD